MHLCPQVQGLCDSGESIRVRVQGVTAMRISKREIALQGIWFKVVEPRCGGWGVCVSHVYFNERGGSGFEVQDSGFGVPDSKFGVRGSGFEVRGHLGRAGLKEVAGPRPQ